MANPDQPNGLPPAEAGNSRKIEIALPKEKRKIAMQGSPKEYTYIIPVTEYIQKALSLPEWFTLDEGEFERKSEFHVTALGFSSREKIREKVAKAQTRGENLLEKIDAALSDTDFSFTIDATSAKVIHNLEYDPEAVRTQTGKAAFESEYTIIVDVEMPGMRAFYDRMMDVGIDLGERATHITLFIKQNGEATGLGIGITDFEGQVAGIAFPHIEYRNLGDVRAI